MSYTLLAHLYPRIKGSQEDIATFSMGYLLEQSSILNEAFTKLIRSKLYIQLPDTLSYHTQDSDQEYGRPDIAGYDRSSLRILCEAKFYAGLTANQPVSYLKRLSGEQTGLIFICPKNRIVSLWSKLCDCCEEGGLTGKQIDEHCIEYDLVHMSIISWGEILENLIQVATDRDPGKLGDLEQLRGFCRKVESEAFVPFKPEDFGAQVARDIDRYYQVVDEVYNLLRTHKELSPSSKGLRKSPRWQGYTQYIRLGDIGVSIDYIRTLWKASSSVETPFWCHFKEIGDSGRWKSTERLRVFLSTIDPLYLEDFYGDSYISLFPKPYLSLEETAEDLCSQILSLYQRLINTNTEESLGQKKNL